MERKQDHLAVNDTSEPIYAGFWIRVGAATIDSVLVLILILPLMIGIYGIDSVLAGKTSGGVWEILITWVLPAGVIILFWLYRAATPGKIMLRVKIADANTGGMPSTGQLIGRYFAYFVATIPLMLGILWVAFDKRKQGWHDKLAGTIVIKT